MWFSSLSAIFFVAADAGLPRDEKRFSGTTVGRRRREGSVLWRGGGLKKSLHSAGQFEDSLSAVHECALHVRRCRTNSSGENGSSRILCVHGLLLF
ncbi:hypothetical protein [Comamonas sp. UBA7528]|uniref:hypothetical protein n=1 Tax=Comamonas sp. UBA7528 TaxID=1946391 RepID=UPI0025BF8196|nr:hypothetical protein [Comamonas sp. UBA7528]